MLKPESSLVDVYSRFFEVMGGYNLQADDVPVSWFFKILDLNDYY